MRNVNAKIGYIVNNVWWGKYDQKIINNIGSNLYDIVVDFIVLNPQQRRIPFSSVNHMIKKQIKKQ